MSSTNQQRNYDGEKAIALAAGAAFAAFYPASVPVAAGVGALIGGYYVARWGWKGLARLFASRLPAPAVQPEPTASLPPETPPTREEIGRQARERYKAALRVLEGAGLDVAELQAARDKAKQLYLRELDGLL